MGLWEIPWPWPITSTDLMPLTNATDTDCKQELHWKDLGETILLSTAAAIFVLLCILKCIVKRSPKNLVIPVDLLTSSPFRLVYCLILTLWAANVFQDAVNPSLYYLSPNNTLLDAAKLFGLTPLVIFPRQALIYLPVLCCVGFTIPCLGHALGFLYTLLMGSFFVYADTVTLRQCSYRKHLTHTDIAVSLTARVPVYVGYVLVAAWFFYSTLHDIISLLFLGKNKRLKDSDVFCDYVKTLLGKNSPSRGCTKGRRSRRSLFRFVQWGFQYVLPYNTGFKYPLSFLAPVFMSSMVIYQFCTELIHLELKLVDEAMRFVKSFNFTVEEVGKWLPSLKLPAENFFYDVISFVESLRFILPFGCLVALGLTALFNLYMVQNFHKRLRRMVKGDISFLVTSEPLPSKPYIVAAGMKYSAFQLSYTVFAWVLYNLLYTLLQVIGLIFYYLFKDFRLLGVRAWAFFMVPMMWASGLHFLQLLLCRYVFKKPSAEEGDVIHIRFESVYHFLSYFFFFFNVLFGVVLSFLRVFASFMFTMVMYFRIDWDVYMRGLEGWDFGHRTYVGYMYLEYTLNNAVLRAFLSILRSPKLPPPTRVLENLQIQQRQEAAGEDQPSSGSSTSSLQGDAEGDKLLSCASITPTSSNVRRKRARNMWFVGYTLIHNPHLRQLTAHQLHGTPKLL